MVLVLFVNSKQFKFTEDFTMRKGLLIVVFMVFSLVFIACGGEKKAEEPAPAPAEQTVAEPAAEGAGVLLAKEILGVFDEIVAKVAELAKEKPEAAALKPQLETLYAEYKVKMEEYNMKYLALKEDVEQWGACNGYLGENRGKHIFDKDAALTEALQHYGLQAGDQEVVDMISKKPVELLNIALNQQVMEPAEEAAPATEEETKTEEQDETAE